MKLPTKVSRADFNKYIDPYLSRARRGPKTKLSRYQIFNYILFVLHTGIQWDRLPTKRNEIHWSNIYKWHSRWSKDESYAHVFEHSVRLLERRGKLDTTLIHGDGSNTVAKKGVVMLDIQAGSIRRELKS